MTVLHLLFTTQLFATMHLLEVPAPKVEATATVGGAIFERVQIEELEGAKVSAGIDEYIVAGMIMQRQAAAAGFRACAIESKGSTRPCGFDDDGDGQFDRLTVWADRGRPVRLKTPIPYTRIQLPSPTGSTERQQLVFLGTAAGALRIGYREFVNGLARPAFAEELTVPIGATFPQTIAVKDVRLTLLKLDGMGLTYRIEPK